MNVSRLLTSMRRPIPLSREGFGWFVLSAAMLLTGLIKSINLITLFACLLIAAGMVNFVLARRQVTGLRIQRDVPDFLIAKTTNPWSLRIHQDRQRARHALCLVDSWPEPIHWIVDLPATSDQTCVREIVPASRGVVSLGPIVARSGYPIGFARFERSVSEAVTIFIAPQLGHLQRGLLRRWLLRQTPTIGAVRTRPRHHPTGQMEFHGLRSFRAGDSRRLIHWRTSARRGELMVREFEEYPNDDLVLIVDLSRSAATDDELFEGMLSLAATIVWEWCRQKGDWLTVVLAGASAQRFAGATGAILRAEVMRALAGARAVARCDVDAVVAALLQAPAFATAHLVLSVGPCELVDSLKPTWRNVLSVLDVATAGECDFFEMNAAEIALPSRE